MQERADSGQNSKSGKCSEEVRERHASGTEQFNLLGTSEEEEEEADRTLEGENGDAMMKRSTNLHRLYLITRWQSFEKTTQRCRRHLEMEMQLKLSATDMTSSIMQPVLIGI